MHLASDRRLDQHGGLVDRAGGRDVDLELTVLADACFDGSGLAVHELLVDERFLTIAEVMTADQWIVRSDEAR